MTGKPLDNVRHERFAKALARGVSASRAYVLAGFKEHDGNASTLRGNQKVQERVLELVEAGARRAEVTVERVVREYARIAFADPRNVLRWTGNATRMDETEAEDSGEVRITANNAVVLFDSDALDDDSAACISEIRQTKDGQLTVKLANKLGALDSLSRILGIFRDKVEHSGSVAIEQIEPGDARAIIAGHIERERQKQLPAPAGETMQ